MGGGEGIPMDFSINTMMESQLAQHVGIWFKLIVKVAKPYYCIALFIFLLCYILEKIKKNTLQYNLNCEAGENNIWLFIYKITTNI